MWKYVAACCLILGAGSARAQEPVTPPTNAEGAQSPAAPGHHPATVLLRSGVRNNGNFEDIQDDEIHLLVGPTDERRIPIEGVAIIDFADRTRNLPADEISLASGRDDLLTLRDGSRLSGKLVDVQREGDADRRPSPDAPIEFVFETTDGQRQRIDAAEVVRVYLGSVPDLSDVTDLVATEPPEPKADTAQAAAEPISPGSSPVEATPASASPGPRSGSSEPPDTAVPEAMEARFSSGRPGTVPARQAWTPTGIIVRVGDLLTITASGEIGLNSTDTAGPAGASTRPPDEGAPLPMAPFGALIARIGESAPFRVGDQPGPFRMIASGELVLGVNERPAALADNTGEFRVTVTIAVER